MVGSCGKLKEEISSKIPDNSCLKDLFPPILDNDFTNPEWYTRYFKQYFERILLRLSEIGWRLILCLDEFDEVRKLFEKSHASLGYIRKMVSSSDPVTVIITSRRELWNLEECVRDSRSKLAGAFKKIYLKAFNEEWDMSIYWSVMSDFDFFPDEAFQKRLIELTGKQPRLLCKFGQQIGKRIQAGEEVTLETLEEIYQEKFSDIYTLYDNWLERIKKDGYQEKIREILFDLPITIYSDDLYFLENIGYIEKVDVGQESENEFPLGYYVISYDFTKYFLEKTKELHLPEWTAITGAEKVLRKMLIKVYPEQKEIQYSTLKDFDKLSGELFVKHPKLSFLDTKFESYKTRIKNNFNYYQHETSLVDTLDLWADVKIICDNWDNFKEYFHNGALNDWKDKLNLLSRVRMPLAHSNEDFLTEAERQKVIEYSKSIIKLESPA